MIRTAVVMIVGVILTAVLAGWLVLSSLLRLPWAGRHCEPLARFWSRSLVRLAGARVRFEGADEVDWDQPYIVVVNHQSWFDVFALAGFLPVHFRFVGKEELARIPIFGPAWTGCGHISIDRDDRSNAIDALKRAGQQVRQDRLAVILFPEGTRSSDGRLQSFKKGAFVLAIQTGVPILPLGITGSRAVMPKGSWRIRPGEILIRVGTPIPVEEFEMKDRNKLVARGRQAILSLIDQPNGLGATGSEPPIPDARPNAGDPEHEESMQ
ncbi:MAG: 1-acyl-sn-glycerol-3-phosphate acyltransferase [Gemmatimonadales bacterium]|nr:MAG: 1-acyl-sn-glycerol-3-phosphate acyltransferase [Gemmatimonadales bacterium]